MEAFLSGIPHALLILVVAGLVLVESIGLPLPGETVLVAALLIAQVGTLSPWWLFAAAAVGAVVGDSIGDLIGRGVGVPVLDVARRKLPRVFPTSGILSAARLMSRYGAWAVFAARFVAVLRVLSGPLSGALRMPYRRFLVANVAGALAWAGAITLAVTIAGRGARELLTHASWVLVVIAAGAVVVAVVVVLVRRRRRARTPPPARSPEHDTRPLADLLAEAAAQGQADRTRKGGRTR